MFGRNRQKFEQQVIADLRSRGHVPPPVCKGAHVKGGGRQVTSRLVEWDCVRCDHVWTEVDPG